MRTHLCRQVPVEVRYEEECGGGNERWTGFLSHPSVMTPTFTCLSKRGALGCKVASTVIPELELDSEIFPAQQRDCLLQIVARWRRNSHLIALNGGLNFLELGVLDRGGDFLGGVAIQGELERDHLFYGVTTRGLDVARIEILDRQAALNELRLKHVPERVHLEVVLGSEVDLSAGSIKGNRR